jgi:phospholipid/cholesterol/gamma-HCH transport system substrate-binding protein
MDSLEADSPDGELVGEALEGVVGATEVFGQHRQAFREVIRGSQQVTSNLVDQTDTLVQLLGDADIIASTLAQRSDAIGQLISDIAELSKQLESFLDENKPAVESLLGRLESITKTMEQTQEDFNETLRQLSAGSRYLAANTGYGPWADVSNPAAIIPDNILCASGLVSGCS